MKFCWRELRPFNTFVMLKTSFSKYRLIKISMICVYINAEVKKKKDTAEMTTVTNKHYIR